MVERQKRQTEEKNFNREQAEIWKQEEDFYSRLKK